MSESKKKRDIKPINECDFVINLPKTLQELGLTRNALAVESKIRPLTINEIASGKVKQINFSTLESILEALNRIVKEKGIDKQYKVSDVFEYQFGEDTKEDSE
ncbi:helix-turn-helix domain-containing protein [Bacillus norwichensis]|uniref:helix-turn-helix domain-containing protein n=1 Tax=Bacillus norwichensis TaxID=2762217 RepID=UPI001CD906F3|nr:helix-turn-helix domain-containing protein [Bacillus norwichensis]